MEDVASGVGVSMVRENLDDIPKYDLPAPYTIRCYQSGDDQNWLRIEKEAEKHSNIMDDLFEDQFGKFPGLLKDRQFFILNPSVRMNQINFT